MKAEICKVLDINEPEKEFYGVKINNGRGRKAQYVYEGTAPFCTDDINVAAQKVIEVNKKLKELNIN